MFINGNQLNEGKFEIAHQKRNKKRFSEGENPLKMVHQIHTSNWKSIKNHNKSNASWERLR